MSRIAELVISRRWLLAAAAVLAIPVSAPVAGAAGPERTVLVTGANRGIGLEFVKQYTDRGWRVIATTRDPASPKALPAKNWRRSVL